MRGHLNFLCVLFPEGVKRPGLDFQAHMLLRRKKKKVSRLAEFYARNVKR